MNEPVHGPRRGTLVPLLVLCVLFAAMTIPMAALGRLGTSEANDQERYHWPTILAMSDHLDSLSLEEYRTATGPVYHFVLAGMARKFGDSQTVIRVINAVLSLPLVLVAYLLVRRQASPWLAALLVLPFVISAYTLSSAIWITTDNASLFFVLAALFAATARGSSKARSAMTSIWAALAVGVRQIHLWVAGPCVLASALRGRHDRSMPWWKAFLFSAPIALPAVIVVGLLVWWWGGLTPPYVEARNAAVGNPFAFGFAMSMLGLFGAFYLPIVQPWKDRAMWRGAALPMVVLAALALTLLTPTTLDKDAGRWGGPIWSIVEALPAVMDRSIVFPPLAMLGAVFLLSACRRAALLGRANEAMVVLAAIVCFTVAHAVQPWCGQRYFEPILLMMAAWLSSLGIEPAARESSSVGDRATMSMWAGPAMLSVMQLAVSVYAVYWQTHAAPG